MIKYHPDTRFLTDYAAGSLPQSQALCVAAHLHYCPACRTRVGELTLLGAELFASQAPVGVAPGSFEKVMGRIEQLPRETGTGIPASGSSTSRNDGLPGVIRKITRGNIENLSWRHIGKAFRFSTIRLGDGQRETSLLHIRAGGAIPAHRHRGDEITVILQGSFSDSEDRYHVGDYLVRTRGETHTPVASQDEDCLCLATLDAPIVMKNLFYRMLMPLFNRPTA